MRLLNYNKKQKKYKHITYAERTMIETWYNSDKKSKKEIAELLHKSERTIRREINRGKVIVKGYEWEDVEEYSAQIAQDKYEYGLTSKGPQLKLDSSIEIVKHIERRYGSKFYNTFKCITFDNGVEFMGYEGLEQSCLRKKKRTVVYYAHPYCSGERGTNENKNRLIRRFIPKGTDMTNIKVSEIKKIEDWINNYPRAMFDYKSSNIFIFNK